MRTYIETLNKRVDDNIIYYKEIGKKVDKFEPRVEKVEDFYHKLSREQGLMEKDICIFKQSIEDIKESVKDLDKLPIMLDNINKNNEKQTVTIDRLALNVDELQNRPAETALSVWKKIGSQVLSLFILLIVTALAIYFGIK